MKQLLLIVFFTLQTIISSAALAWSSPVSVEFAADTLWQCHSVVATNEEAESSSEEGEDEEDEEPDCD